MPHRPPSVFRPAPGRRPHAAIAVVAFVLVVAGCGGARIPVVSFDPASACTTDGREQGAYPELEALVRRDYEGRAPDHVDSGRNCTKGALGVLSDAGIAGVRFAGATWSFGASSALTVAVFEADGLDPADMIAFYETSARADTHTERLTTADTTVAGQPARRLDVLLSDGTGQTIVAWPGGAPGRVDVLLASDLGDSKVATALDTFGAR
jgi:hypothetical protein